jgi:hypothetical protein
MPSAPKTATFRHCKFDDSNQPALCEVKVSAQPKAAAYGHRLSHRPAHRDDQNDALQISTDRPQRFTSPTPNAPTLRHSVIAPFKADLSEPWCNIRGRLNQRPRVPTVIGLTARHRSVGRTIYGAAIAIGEHAPNSGPNVAQLHAQRRKVE